MGGRVLEPSSVIVLCCYFAKYTYYSLGPIHPQGGMMSWFCGMPRDGDGILYLLVTEVCVCHLQGDLGMGRMVSEGMERFKERVKKANFAQNVKVMKKVVVYAKARQARFVRQS